MRDVEHASRALPGSNPWTSKSILMPPKAHHEIRIQDFSLQFKELY